MIFSPHIDYGNIIERVQYNDALAITGAIKGTSQQKITVNLVLNLCTLEDGPDDCVLLIK